MTRFQVSAEQHEGHTVYVLRDMHTKATARIVPALGANCLQLSLAPSDEDAPVPVIDDLKFIGNNAASPSRYGIPVLFPWPSGIADGAFLFNGITYSLNAPGEKKTRHHGFANRAAWRVVRSDCDNTGAWLTCVCESDKAGELGEKYPSRCQLEMTWALRENKLEMTMAAQNSGDTAMPLGVGLHPYFTIPFGPKGSRAECRLSAQTGREWDLDATTGVGPDDPKPASAYLPAPKFNPAAEGGSPLRDTKFNFLYDAEFDNTTHQTSASVIDPANRIRLTVSASREFGKWVFYTPPDRDAIALEPWTLTANGFNLAAKGIENTGMITLKPGDKWTGQVSIYVAELP